MASKVSLPFGKPKPALAPGVGKDGKPKEAEGKPERKRKMPNPVLLALLALAMAALGFQIGLWGVGHDANPALSGSAENENSTVRAKEPNPVLAELLKDAGEQAIRIEPVIRPLPSGRTDPFTPLVAAPKGQEASQDMVASSQVAREVLPLVFPEASVEPAKPQPQQEPAASNEPAGQAQAEAPAAGTSGAEEDKPPETEPPDLAVTGIIFDETRSYAVVRVGGESRPVKAGDEIAPGVVVRSISREAVIVEKQGTEFEFKLGGGTE